MFGVTIVWILGANDFKSDFKCLVHTHTHIHREKRTRCYAMAFVVLVCNAVSVCRISVEHVITAATLRND